MAICGQSNLAPESHCYFAFASDTLGSVFGAQLNCMACCIGVLGFDSGGGEEGVF